MIKNVLVLGAGSAGLLVALSLKRKIPQLQVRVVRSPEIGVIGVGEGTTPNFPQHLFDYLGLSRKQFYAAAQPTWKLGIRFLWGPRDHFNYGFSQALDSHWHGLPRPNGYYCDEDFRDCDLPTALMSQDKVFARQPNGGGPDVQGWHAFHIENKKFVETLEIATRASGVQIIDGKVSGVQRQPDGEGITAVMLEDGRQLDADFFVDASGFRSELLGRALEEPFISYDRSLFCDRAVIGGWERTDEPILPYTTAETMEAGWSWQIEHEHHINRGYVYSSQAISDDDARSEFLRKNPKAPKDGRIVKFRSGRYRRNWVGNVVAIGNSAGFVEPLEATALMVVCAESRTLVDCLLHTALAPTPSMVRLYNRTTADTWDEVRNFLALHYKLNTRLDNPFWRHCREDTDVSGIGEMLEFYEENGPTGFNRHLLHGNGGNFGIEGWLVMLVGNRFPYRARHVASAQERGEWERRCAELAAQARTGMSVKEALGYVRHPGWQWAGDPAR
jgi:tryptophan halogenase